VTKKPDDREAQRERFEDRKTRRLVRLETQIDDAQYQQLLAVTPERVAETALRLQSLLDEYGRVAREEGPRPPEPPHD
jgi:hypothetical protein